MFQLADFGLAHYQSEATTFCGTRPYMAPELYSLETQGGQSTKMDVWSLYATMAAAVSAFKKFPPSPYDYKDALGLLRSKVVGLEGLEPMVRLEPERRASAAQMIVRRFDGKGLTTPRSEVLPIEPDVEDVLQEDPPRRTGPTKGNGSREAASPLIVSLCKRPLPPKKGDMLRTIQDDRNRISKCRSSNAGVPTKATRHPKRGDIKSRQLDEHAQVSGSGDLQSFRT